MVSLVALLCFVLAVFSCGQQRTGSAQPLSSASDRAGLYSLRASLGLRARDWPRKADPCTAWAGVACRSGRVVVLDLSGLRRTRLGRLAPRFAVDGLHNLSRLASLNASGFPLPGPIPDALAGAGALAVVSLSGCSITGGLPGSVFSRLPGLVSLDLSSNLLSGDVPPELGVLKRLETLALSNNNLSGLVPPELGNLTSLVHVDLSFNNLSGTLPESLLSGLSRLQSAKLNHNRFSSSLPSSVWSLPELTSLDVSNNNFTGTLPEVVTGRGNASGVLINISDNIIYGQVGPGFVAFLRRFALVDVSHNYLEGGAAIGSGSTNALLDMNCFNNASNQRSKADCEEFYRERGIAYDVTLPANHGKGNHKWKYIVAATLSGVTFGVLVVVALVMCLMKRRRPAANQRNLSNNSVHAGGVVAPLPHSPPLVSFSSVGDAFTYEQLLKVTENANLVKKGHSGDLYSGILDDGSKVVVKRVDMQAVRNDSYIQELSFFSKVSNRRFVPLIGHCLDKENEKLLVYKYMPNGDLASALHTKSVQDKEELQSLDWITRLKIAMGVAEALCFLHHEINPPLVHRDLEASSILLDDKYEVRIGSLGEICTEQADDHSKVLNRVLRSQKRVKGIPGSSNTATCAYDIYCLGKVLLELVTGKIGISGSKSAITAEWLEDTLINISMNDKELTTRILDPLLRVNEDHLEEVWAMAIIAKSCLNARPSKRPLARHVLKALENPLKVVRQNSINTSRFRTSSFRGSWHGAIFGSFPQNISDASSTISTKEARTTLRNGVSGRSQGSTGPAGDYSLSQRRMSREIFPEPEDDYM